MLHRFTLLPIALTLAAALPASAAQAQEKADGPWSIDAAVTVVSDYRFRGLSLSDKDPAIQPELTISHDSGLYVGFWGSTIADNGGDNIETDLSVGFAKSLGAIDFDVSAQWYFYPGASGLNYLEITTNLSTAVGPATVGLALSYAPAQANIGDEDNRYIALNASIPLGKLPLSAIASVGVEDGAFGDSKIDWSIGLAAEVEGFEFSVSYVDAARHGFDPLAEPGVVLSIKKAF